ncbi:c-type cytochrome [Candidatus Acetothermia bacterium]|nr:c-type cytochrome [Candidatus Acetothermia bacterium]
MNKQEHKHISIGTCLKVWGFIVALVALSYVVFLLQIEPLWLRRVIFIAIALLQAVLSVTYFMQLRAERPGLVYAIVPPVSLLLALVIFGLSEGDYVWGVRQTHQWLTTGKPVIEEPDKNGGTTNPIEKGMQLAQSNGCLSCHSVTGEKIVGPSWKGLYGSPQELEGGTTVTADEAYLKESIVNPGAKIVKSFPNVMPPYKTLNEEQLDAIIAYIKSLSSGGSK